MIIPKCVRFTASSPLSFDQCLSRNGFSYPVLVRPSQRQTGVRVVRVDGPEDRQRVVHLPWSGQPHVITEFVEFATSAGKYLKARVLFAGEYFFIRHVKSTTTWREHNGSAAGLRDFNECEMALIGELGTNDIISATGRRRHNDVDPLVGKHRFAAFRDGSGHAK